LPASDALFATTFMATMSRDQSNFTIFALAAGEKAITKRSYRCVFATIVEKMAFTILAQKDLRSIITFVSKIC